MFARVNVRKIFVEFFCAPATVSQRSMFKCQVTIPGFIGSELLMDGAMTNPYPP